MRPVVAFGGVSRRAERREARSLSLNIRMARMSAGIIPDVNSHSSGLRLLLQPHA